MSETQDILDELSALVHAGPTLGLRVQHAATLAAAAENLRRLTELEAAARAWKAAREAKTALWAEWDAMGPDGRTIAWRCAFATREAAVESALEAAEAHLLRLLTPDRSEGR